jgi:CHASE3 domain sensor protein
VGKMNKKIIGIFFGICLVIGAVGFVSLQSEDTKDTSRQLQTNKADPSKYVVKKSL